MALGATPTNVETLIVRQALIAVLGGVALGLVAAWVTAQFMAPLLYGVAAFDPGSLSGSALLVLAMAAAAAAIPAIRVARINPAAALREDH